VKRIKTNVLIVGAGPAGAVCGIRLQQAGIECMLVDRMKYPREKLCAGLFTHKSQFCLKQLIGDKKYESCMNYSLMSQEDTLSIYKGKHHLFSCKPKDPITLLNRPRFDEWLVEHFVSLSGRFRDGEELIGIDIHHHIAEFQDFEMEYSYLIAADGNNSTVERLLALQHPDTGARKNPSALCLEINVDRADLDMKGVNIFLDIVPNSYAWVFSKGEQVCVGLIKLADKQFNVNNTMRRFMSDLNIKNPQKYPLKGAMIPVGNYMPTPAYGNILFVGDAAGLVEPLTCEGIYHAMQSGVYAADSIIDTSCPPSVGYNKKLTYLKKLIDKGGYYQHFLEMPWSVNMFYKHAAKHPNFIRFFYDTQIEHASLDSLWKIILKYKMLVVTLFFAFHFNFVGAQIPIDSTDFVPISWNRAMRQTKYEWFISKQAIAVADSIVKYQMPSGGWVKNQDWGLNPDSLYLAECMFTGIGSTIDNGATYQEMEFLAKMYYYTNLIRYRIAFLNGLDYLLRMQYDNGGWPQFYPSRGKDHYSNHITFNDNAMINVMKFLLSISRNEEPYDMLWLKPEQREACKKAYDKGVECILNCQIIVDGQPTVWCQQHDEVTLKPTQARSYELPSFCGAGETTAIVELLLSLPNPSERIILAIDGAIRWLENHKIEGKALERYINNEGKSDLRLVDREDAPALWARFYDLVHEEPLFCGRDGIPKKHFDEIEYERRNGYSWFGTQPQRLINLYKDWSKRVLDKYILYDD